MSAFAPEVWPEAARSRETLVKRVDLTIAQVILLNSSPQTLVAGVPGYIARPHESVLIRRGARYATAPGNLTLRCVTSSPFAWITHSSAFLTGTPDSNGTFANYGNVGTTGGNASEAATDLGGKAIQLFSLTNNPTVDGTNAGSDIIVLVYYRLIPTTTANVDVF